MTTVLKRFVVLFGLWLVVTEGDPSAWLVGVAAAGAAVGLSIRLLPPTGRPVRLVTVLGLAPGFVAASISGGVDVAWRALHPRLPLRPAWLMHGVRLPPGPPRVSLGGVLSLMPGTLAAGSHDGTLLIHCLDDERPVAAAVAREERRIGETLGLATDPADA
jgi:multicomponent Na+:H+ antiporter subunit E